MLKQRKSTQNMLMGLIFMCISAGLFGWMFGYFGSLPAGWNAEAAKRIGQVAGGIGGIGGVIFLSGLLRRLFRSKVDYEQSKLVNFVLRFGIVFMMFGLGVAAMAYLIKTMAPGMLDFKLMDGYYLGAGLAFLGLVLFVIGIQKGIKAKRQLGTPR